MFGGYKKTKALSQQKITAAQLEESKIDMGTPQRRQDIFCINTHHSPLLFCDMRR
jgi:hypothetical protein